MVDPNAVTEDTSTESLFNIDKKSGLTSDDFHLFPRELRGPNPLLSQPSSANDVFLIVRSFKNDHGIHAVSLHGKRKPHALELRECRDARLKLGTSSKWGD